MLLLAFALLVGLLLTKQRRLLWTSWFAIGLAIAAVTLAPNIAWQGAHAWPFLQVVQGDFAHRHAFQTGLQLEYKSLSQNTLAFITEQLIYTNPLSVPIWLIGLGTLAFSARYRDLRFIALAYVVLLAAAIALQGKGYYIIGVYAALISAGSVAIEALVRRQLARTGIVVVFLAGTLPFVPLSLPVLPVDTFIAYTKALHLTGNDGETPHLMQPLYAEEFGWEELTEHVAQVYHSLPPSVRARTGVFADTYADAGALEFYGARYGLPPVISAQNTYYLWGTQRYDGKTLIVVGASQSDLVRQLYRNVKLVATYGNPYKWVVEGPTPIYVCTDPIAPLPQLWPRLKWYGA
jgi:hypothetical protein